MTTWMKLENIVLSEKTQVPKGHRLYDSIYMKYLESGKSIETEGRLVVAWDGTRENGESLLNGFSFVIMKILWKKTGVIIEQSSEYTKSHWNEHLKWLKMGILLCEFYLNKNLKDTGGFPGDSAVKNLPANAGDTASIPGPGKFHMPWGNLSLCVCHSY